MAIHARPGSPRLHGPRRPSGSQGGGRRRPPRALAPDDWAVHEDWRDRYVLGAFGIVQIHRTWMVLHNLIDELDYQAHPTAGLEQPSHAKFPPSKPGATSLHASCRWAASGRSAAP